MTYFAVMFGIVLLNKSADAKLYSSLKTLWRTFLMQGVFIIQYLQVPHIQFENAKIIQYFWSYYGI